MVEKKYNAFISYRHSEKDSLIASEIQTRLERFKIPKDIQKKTGVKRFERIFRDKEELPITSDLNDDIDRALEESEHLIVICSERTSESIWVQKEIETFLKYHKKKNIFTVLVDGEPGEVIPDILLHDTVTRKMADGSEVTREELIEPLSCDYRLGIKKARKVELPRLAASMLGCSYDELIRRRRQYIRRRNTAIISCALVMLACIIGYLCWSLVQIRKNYERAETNYALAQENYELAQDNYMDSLSNQSRYLAAESSVLLNNDDRVGAMQLALAALPSEDNERPVTPEAIYALHNALGTYTVPGYNDVSPVWKYSTGKKIKKYMVSPDQKYLALWDESGAVTIWNLPDHSAKRTFEQGAFSVTDVIFSADSELILSTKDKLICFDKDFKETKWSAAIDGGYDTGDILSLSENGKELLYSGGKEIDIIDAVSGNITESHIPEEEIVLSPDDNIGSVLRAELDASGRYLEIECTDWGTYSVYIYDRTENNWIKADGQIGYITNRCFDDDGIIISYIEDVFSSSSAFGSMETLSENNCIISKYSVSDGNLMWEQAVPHTLVGYESRIRILDCTFGGKKIKCAVSMFSNKCAFIDLATGELLSVRELPSEYIDSYVLSSGKTLSLVLRDGKYLYITLDDLSKAMVSLPYFNDNVRASDMYRTDHAGNSYLIEYSSEDSVIEYNGTFYDKSFSPLDEMDNGVLVYDSLAAEGCVLLFGNNMKLYCYNTSYNKIIWSSELEGSYYTSISFLGSDGNGNAYLINNNSLENSDRFGSNIYKFRISDGEGEYIEDLPGFSQTGIRCVNTALYFPASGNSGEGIYKYDMSDGSLTFTGLAGDIPDSLYSSKISISPDEKKIILVHKKEGIPAAFMADLKDGGSDLLDTSHAVFSAWSDDSSAFVTGDEEGFTVFDSKGNKLFEALSGENKLVSVYAGETYIASVDSFGYMSFYDYDGNLLGSCEITVKTGALFEDTKFEIIDDNLMINSGSIGNLVYTTAFKPLYMVTGYLTYLEDSDRYIVRSFSPSASETSAGWFKKMTLDDLIYQGNQYLAEAAISEEMKNRYGF